MPLPSPKELKKIAKACREAGIKVYRAEGIELHFTDEAPVKHKMKSKKQTTVDPEYTSADGDFVSEALNEEALLFWSASDGGQQFDPYKE